MTARQPGPKTRECRFSRAIVNGNIFSVLLGKRIIPLLRMTSAENRLSENRRVRDESHLQKEEGTPWTLEITKPPLVSLRRRAHAQTNTDDFDISAWNFASLQHDAPGIGNAMFSGGKYFFFQTGKPGDTWKNPPSKWRFQGLILAIIWFIKPAIRREISIYPPMGNGKTTSTITICLRNHPQEMVIINNTPEKTTVSHWENSLHFAKKIIALCSFCRKSEFLPLIPIEKRTGLHWRPVKIR